MTDTKPEKPKTLPGWPEACSPEKIQKGFILRSVWGEVEQTDDYYLKHNISPSKPLLLSLTCEASEDFRQNGRFYSGHIKPLIIWRTRSSKSLVVAINVKGLAFDQARWIKHEGMGEAGYWKAVISDPAKIWREYCKISDEVRERYEAQHAPHQT